jgi:hypothetical protein
MTTADHPSAGHRRGRYLLPAVIVGLTAIAATAFGLGAFDDATPRQPARTAVVADVPPQDVPAAKSLTTGPQMATSPPIRLAIPALKVSVPVGRLGLAADGAMEVPTDAKTVGWFTKAPTPGSLGPAVLAGHVDYRGKPGTFAHLADMKPGDQIDVARQDGSMAMFVVTQVNRYPKDRFPTNAVYGPISHAGLRLITCGGDFDHGTGHYVDNIVVYAALKMAHPAG